MIDSCFCLWFRFSEFDFTSRDSFRFSIRKRHLYPCNSHFKGYLSFHFLRPSSCRGSNNYNALQRTFGIKIYLESFSTEEYISISLFSVRTFSGCVEKSSVTRIVFFCPTSKTSSFSKISQSNQL